MTLYSSPPYSHQPIRFRVPELHTSTYHIENPDGIEVVQACDYDELRRAYDGTYALLLRALREIA